MKTKNDSLNTIDGISKLEYNWNENGADPIPKKVIDLSKEIIMILDVQPEIFCTANDSIQFEYTKENGDYLEFEIFEDKINVLEVFQSSYDNSRRTTVDINNYIVLSDILNDFMLNRYKNNINRMIADIPNFNCAYEGRFIDD